MRRRFSMPGKRQPFKCLVLCILLVAVTWTLTTVEVIHGFCSNETTTTATTTMAPINNRHMHVLLAATDSDQDFLQELHMAIKTVILNAPIDFGLQIHIMTDSYGSKSLQQLWFETELAQWKIPQPLTMHVYHISEETTRKWGSHVTQLFQHQGFSAHELRTHLLHRLGTYVRLYAHKVLMPEVTHVLYMDTDIVLMANLQTLWPSAPYTNPTQLFAWTNVQCAGFMIIHIRPGLDEIWRRAQQAPQGHFRELVPDHNPNDQLLLRYIQATAPDLVGQLPDSWDGTVAAGLWRHGGTNLTQTRPQLGMMHFHVGVLQGSYWKAHPFLKDTASPETQHTWGLAQAQLRMPWEWVRSQVESKNTKDYRAAAYGVSIYTHHVLEEDTETVRRVVQIFVS
jgi:Glycosyl transferase family 8